MKMEILGSAGNYLEEDVQALAVAVFKDEKADDGFLKELDEATGGLIRSVIESEELKGKEGDTAYLHLGSGATKAKRLLLIGVGAREDFKTPQISQFAGTAVRALRAKNIKSIAVVPRAEGDAEKIAVATAEGAYIGLFDPDKYRTVDKEERTVDRLVVSIPGAETDALSRGAQRGRIIGESVNFTRDMANEPGGYMTPTDMAERAREIAGEFGLSIDVLDEARMEQEGMGALLSVSAGSEQPAKLIILKYTPRDGGGATTDEQGKELLAFVGKGVTFDSGGISIKPGEHGVDEVRHDGRRNCHRSDARHSTVKASDSGARRRARHGESSFGQGHEARRRGARHVRQDHRSYQHGCRRATDSGGCYLLR
jgi:leucyl aminopeptidase